MERIVPNRSPLELGALTVLAALAIAAVAGLIAVGDADHVAASFGTGLGVALATFLVGATMVVALACLSRGALEPVALAGTIAAGVALDLLVVAIWLDIDSEAYGKTAAVAFAWSFFALVVLGLALALGAPGRIARSLYAGAVVTTICAALISTWLIVTASGDSAISEGTTVPVAPDALGDDALLRALGAAFVLLAALWFGAIAADRLERRASGVTR